MELIGNVELAFRRVLEKGVMALDWAEFEALAAVLFEEMMYRVEFTPPTDDQGVDLKLYERVGGAFDVAQCKHWKSDVGSPVVRDFYGAILHCKARKGFLVVCTGLSRSAQEFISGKPIEILDLNKIMNHLCIHLMRLGYEAGYKRGHEEGQTSKIVLP